MSTVSHATVPVHIAPDSVGVVPVIPQCSCPETISDVCDLCPACKLDYEIWVASEVPTELEPADALGMPLSDWVALQAMHYRRNPVDDPDVNTFIVDALDSLHTQIVRGKFLTVGEVRADDPAIGSTWVPKPRGTVAGDMILDEMYRYERGGSDADRLVYDILWDLCQEVNHGGAANYKRRLAEIRAERRRWEGR